MWELETKTPKSREGQQAVELFNDVQLMKEMGWSYEALLATPEDVVWAALQVLSESARRDKDELRKAKRGH